MKVRPVVVAEAIFLSFLFFLANIRSSIFWSLYPPVETITEPAWRETLLWLLALFLMYYLLIKHDLFHAYLQAWQRQPLLIIFVLFSLASIFWSTAWTVTLHRSLAFIFGTSMAVYLGVKYSTSQLLRVLTLLGSVILIASYLLIFLNPNLGTAPGSPYYGAWRGIFWHKNQFGNIMPIFTLVFLMYLFSSGIHRNLSEKVVAALLYILSLIAVFFSKSASGYILVFIVHLTFGAAFLWLKARHLLRPSHYYIVLAISLVAGIGVLLNLDFVFGLVGREANLTGRIPMWGILFREVFPLHPWFGQGFGTIWADLDFRLYMRDLTGWTYPVLIGDNGFIDILLNLGIVGLALFLLNYAKTWIVSVKFFLSESSLESFFPFTFMVYSLFANLTFSLFMETEIFVWILIVALLVSSTRRAGDLAPA